MTATAECERLCLPAADAAARLGISRALFYEMAADGRLGPMPIAFGRRRVWRSAELAAWVAAGAPPRREWLKRQGGDG